MTAVLLDTHAWAWSLVQHRRLSTAAVDAMRAGDVRVSPISFFEITQKVRLGKWPDMEPFAPRLVDLLTAQGGYVAGLTPQVCLDAGRMTWAHRDPFDRFIAATARHYRLPVVSADQVFDDVVTRIW